MTVFIVVVVFICAAIALHKSSQPVLKVMSDEEMTLYVGRTASWNLVIGIAGGTQIMLYRVLPPPEHFADTNSKSDGSLYGDVNRVYRELKQSAKDLASDYQAESNLNHNIGLMGGVQKSTAELFKLDPQTVERQKAVAAACKYGDAVRVVVHSFTCLKPGGKLKPGALPYKWVELLAVEAREAVDPVPAAEIAKVAV